MASSSTPKRKAITPAQRFAVASRQGWKCTYQPRGKPVCNADLKSQPYQVDHIHALVHGGENSLANYRAMCIPCHKIKTKADVQDNAKVKRLRRETKQKAKKRIQSRGFDKTLSRHMNGTVSRRY